MEEERTIAYQQQMQQQYRQSFRGLRREDYQDAAGAQFKKDYWPADLDGILVNANSLCVADLVAIHKAAKLLETQGNEALASELVQQHQGVQGSYDWQTSVRVNPLFLDGQRQRATQICELLQAFYWGTCEGFTAKREEILKCGDAQLIEMIRQVDEALKLTDRKLKVME